MSKVLIIGCGGVASVAIHKCCQVPEVFTEICIASRTKAKCDKLAAELAPKTTTKITTAQVDADHVDEVIALIRRSPTVAVSEPAASTDGSASGSSSQVAFTVDSVDSLESARFAGLPNMMVRSASSSTSSCECEMSSMVTPRDLSPWMSPCTRAAASSSRPAVGSSRINAFGSHAITPAIATSRCWPPDRSNGERSRRCSICSSRMACMARSIASDVSNPRLEGPYATSSATVSANSCRSGCCMT